MKFDLHTHHVRCGHARGTIREYIESAIQLNFNVIGISDHSPYFASELEQPEPQIAMAKQEFVNYVEEVLQLKKEYAGKIKVLLGVESDYFPEYAHIYKQIYDQYPFDYVIGSVHASGGISIFNRNRWKHLTNEQQIEQKEQYYRLIQQSARAGMFQILGHIDAMKAYYPAFSEIPTPIVDQTLKVIGETGVAIEVNTSGSTKKVGGWYPSDEMLERALYYQVEISFGSDAHIPSRVGDEWEIVRKKLQQLGFTYWVYFENKQKQKVSLI